MISRSFRRYAILVLMICLLSLIAEGNLIKVYQYDASGSYENLLTSGTYAYVIENYHGLDMFDVSDGTPRFLHRYQSWLGDGPKFRDISGIYMCQATAPMRLMILAALRSMMYPTISRV